MMTEHLSVISSLKSIFPESSWPWAIPALRHDSIIWSSLADQDFFNKIAEVSHEPRDWTPHRLAAVALRQDNFESLPEEIVTASQAALSQLLESGNLTVEQVGDFKHSSRIAVALHHCLLADDWQEFEVALQSSTQINSAWFTPLVVLYGLVQDPVQLKKQLITRLEDTNILPLIIHTVLSQPLPMEETKQVLWQILTGLELVKTAAFLELLSRDRPEMSMLLANEYLQANPPAFNGESITSLGDHLNQVTEDLLTAQILTLAGQLDKAEQLKTRSLGDLNALQIEVSNQLVAESLLDKNIEYALSQWTRTSASPKLTPPAGLVVELLRAGRVDDSITLLPDTDGNTQTPLRWLNNIYQALEHDDIAQARLFAHQTLNSFTDIYEQDPAAAEKAFGSRRDLLKFLTELINRLADLALYKESFQAAQIATSINPDDPLLLMTVIKSARSAGEHSAAIDAAQFAVAIEPTHPEFRRQLAKSLESAELWSLALPERQAILEHRFAQSSAPSWPTSEDQLAYANCAINGGRPSEAFEVCQKTIELDPSDGHAHAILGEALSAMGDDEQAMEHFSLATQLAPHKAAPWLSLAQAYQRTGHTDKSIETLRTASHAVPDDPGIFLSLGKVHINEGSPSQAQSAMERAYQLVAQPQAQEKSGKSSTSNTETFARNREQLCEIALAYGEILEQLGHQEQANQVFEDAYQAYPAYPGLAYVYAKSLLNNDDEKAALAPLAIAVSSNPSEAQPYIEYARALLHARENPQDAVQALETALELIEKQYHEGDPEADEIRCLATALLAQAQEAAGELIPALQTYTMALETPIADDEQWRSQLAIGLGRVAIQLEQPEVAIAALQDPNQKEIQHTEVAQILCEAYAAISLTQESLFAARSAVHLSPDNVDILAWFANKATELGVTAEAVPALTSAAQLDSKRTDLIIRLAQVQARMGKEDAAKEAFLSALSSPYSTPDDLYHAADGLSDLGEDEAAADCLERALELQPHPPLNLIIELSNAYKTTGKPELAIKSLDKGIDQYAENALLHAYKADLLGKLGRQQAARACLEHALILEPDNPAVHLQIAFVLQEQDELQLALEHASIASRDLASRIDRLAALGLAAELARSTLQEDKAKAFLDTARSVEEQASPQDDESPSLHSLFNYHCVLAESTLELEEQIAAAAAMNEASVLDPEHPRLLALQSRMAIRQGDRDAAKKAIGEVIQNIEEAQQEDLPVNLSPNTLLGIALAAMDLFYWDRAASILDQAAAITPHDSNLHLQKARLFVLRAEFQRLCQYLDIINHAPGGAALSPRTFRVFSEAIQKTTNTLSQDMQVDPPSAVDRWTKRGSIAFQPDADQIQTIEDLPEKPSDQAALLTALGQNGESTQVARFFHSIQSKADTELLHHSIYSSYALALIATGQDQIAFEQATDAILSAIDQYPSHAIYHVIQAKVAEQLGDWHIALKAMQAALSLWSDESRWQAYFGKLLLLNDQYPESVLHYLSAIEMEPEYLQHYLDLSQAYMRNGEPGQAVSILQQGVKIAPDKVEPYLALASTYYEQQNYIQAKRNSDLATKIAPEQSSPLLLSARIALKLDDPGQAKAKSEAVLRINPDDSQALYIQAQAYADLGDTEQALQVVEKAIPLSNEPLSLYLQRADLLAAAGDSQDLLSELKAIADQYPDEPLVLGPLAKAYAEAGQKNEAIQAAQQALHRSSRVMPLDEQAQLHHLLGRLLRDTGQLDQSIHQLSEAIRIAPQTLNSYLELGLTQEERRQFEPALETYKKAINIYPTDARPYHQAGLLLKSSRDYPAAESMLRKAAERDPENVEIHRQLAALVALNLVHSRQPITTEI
jgi:tetratricopeptide (TPR) repeat protein